MLWGLLFAFSLCPLIIYFNYRLDILLFVCLKLYKTYSYTCVHRFYRTTPIKTFTVTNKLGCVYMIYSIKKPQNMSALNWRKCGSECMPVSNTIIYSSYSNSASYYRVSAYTICQIPATMRRCFACLLRSLYCMTFNDINGVCVAYSLVFYVVSCVLLFVCLFFSFLTMPLSFYFQFLSLTVPLVSFVPLLQNTIWSLAK